MSIVVNELIQLGIRTVIRVGTSGSIQEHVRAGSVVIGSGAVTNQGAADDIAPPRFPAVADPFLTVVLADAAQELGIDHHVGVMASTDTFFEGQERAESSANPHLLRRLRGIIDEYHDLGVLNFEMEAGTLFKMGVVYGFAAGCVCAIIAQRTEDEQPRLDEKDAAVDRAIAVAIAAADAWTQGRDLPGKSALSTRRPEPCRAARLPLGRVHPPQGEGTPAPRGGNTGGAPWSLAKWPVSIGMGRSCHVPCGGGTPTSLPEEPQILYHLIELTFQSDIADSLHMSAEEADFAIAPLVVHVLQSPAVPRQMIDLDEEPIVG